MLTVSNYHYIRKDFSNPYPSIFGFTPEEFFNQLKVIKELGECIHPQILLKDPQAILESKKNYFLITFDDGLREQYKLAKPILDDLDIPALFFINSMNIEKQKVSLVHKIHILRSIIAPISFFDLLELFDLGKYTSLSLLEKNKATSHYNYDDTASAYIKYILNFKMPYQVQKLFVDEVFTKYENEKEIAQNLYMNLGQIKDLAEQDMLGSHSYSHYPLGLLSSQEIENEIQSCKGFLDKNSINSVRTISYPYGSYEACQSPVGEIARKAGHCIGFTMERGINTGVEDLLRLKRFDCNDLPLGKNSKVYHNAYSAFHQ